MPLPWRRTDLDWSVLRVTFQKLTFTPARVSSCLNGRCSFLKRYTDNIVDASPVAVGAPGCAAVPSEKRKPAPAPASNTPFCATCCKPAGDESRRCVEATMTSRGHPRLVDAVVLRRGSPADSSRWLHPSVRVTPSWRHLLVATTLTPRPHNLSCCCACGHPPAEQNGRWGLLRRHPRSPVPVLKLHDAVR